MPVPPTLERKNDDGFLLPCDISKPEFIPFKKDSEESTDASAKKNSLTSMYTKVEFITTCSKKLSRCCNC